MSNLPPTPVANPNAAFDPNAAGAAPDTSGLDSLYGVSGIGEAPVILVAGGPAPVGTQQSNYAPGTAGPFLPPGAQYPATTTTVRQALQDYYYTDPHTLAGLQQDLYAGGFYAPSYYTDHPNGPALGVHDDDTYAAYQSALVRSARAGKPLTTVIDESKKNGPINNKTPKSAIPPPLTIKLTNSKDVAASAQAVAEKTLGRFLSPDELKNFVDSFHATEATQQRAEWQASYGNEGKAGIDPSTLTPRGPGGVIEQAPSLNEAYLAQELTQQDPKDAAAVRYSQGIADVESFLHSSESIPSSPK